MPPSDAPADGNPARGSRLAWIAAAAGIVALGFFEFAPLWPSPPVDDDAYAFMMMGRALAGGEYTISEGVAYLTGIFRGITKIGVLFQIWALHTLAGERLWCHLLWCAAWHLLYSITCYLFARRVLAIPRDRALLLFLLVLSSMTALGVLASPTFTSYSFASVAVLACGIFTRWGLSKSRIVAASIAVAVVTSAGLLFSELSLLCIVSAVFGWWSAPRDARPAGVARFAGFITPAALPASAFVGWSILLLTMGDLQGGASPLSRLTSTVAADFGLLGNIGLTMDRLDGAARWLFIAPDTSFGLLPRWASVLVAAIVIAGAARSFLRDPGRRVAVAWGALHTTMFSAFLISRHLNGYTEYRHAYVAWFGVAILWLAAAEGLSPLRKKAAIGVVVTAALVAFNAAAARHDARILRSYGESLALSARGVGEEIRAAPPGSRIWAFCCTRSESFIRGVGPDAEVMASLIAQLPGPTDKAIALLHNVRPAPGGEGAVPMRLDESPDLCLAHRSDGLFGRVSCADLLAYFGACGLRGTCPQFERRARPALLRLTASGVDLAVEAEMLSPVTFFSVMGIPETGRRMPGGRSR